MKSKPFREPSIKPLATRNFEFIMMRGQITDFVMEVLLERAITKLQSLTKIPYAQLNFKTDFEKSS